MKRTTGWTFLISLVNAGLIVFAVYVSANVLAQTPTRPKPAPSPRRPLPKPVGGSRGFEQYARREASSRLVAGAGTRGATDPARLRYEEGEAAYAAGKYQKAIADFFEAVRLSPNWAEAHYALALSLTETQKLKAAIEEFKRVLKLKAKYELMVLSNYNIGNAYVDLGEYKEAIDAYKQAIELNPELSKPHNNLGLAYVASDQIPAALAEFKEAVQLKPDFAEAHFNLGVAYLQSGKKHEAEEEQQILTKLEPDLATKLKILIKK
ncbi:MAG: tetratricopeptide repeat protein [Blastocatellia bacterium]|nr:tetratricopeptide repeat protein [Blastocatellia bacterium]